VIKASNRVAYREDPGNFQMHWVTLCLMILARLAFFGTK
jgi:hypothetical protein